MASSSNSAATVTDTWIPTIADQISDMRNAGESFNRLFGPELTGRVLKQSATPDDEPPTIMQVQAMLYMLVGQLRLEDLQNTLKAFLSQKRIPFDDLDISTTDPSQLNDAQLIAVMRIFQGSDWLPPAGETDIVRRNDIMSELKPRLTNEQASLVNNEMRLGATLSGALDFKAALPANQYLATAEYFAHSLVKMSLKEGMLVAVIDPNTQEPRLWKVVSGIDRDGFGAFFLVPRQKDLRQIIFLGRGTDPSCMQSIQGNLSESAGSGRCDQFSKDLENDFIQAIMALGPNEPFILECYGHSQGGAICSVMVTRLMNWARGLNQTVPECNVITFMAPGISKKHASPFIEMADNNNETHFNIVHVRCQAKRLKNRDIVPTLGEVRLGKGCEGAENVDTFLQTWKAPNELMNAHRALIFDRTKEQECLASYGNIMEHVEKIETSTARLEQHLVHSLHGIAARYQAELASLEEPKKVPETTADLNKIRRSKRKKPIVILQLLLRMLPAKLEEGTLLAWQEIMEEANQLSIQVEKEYKSWLELRMKMRSTSNSKAGVIYSKSYGKLFDGAKQSFDEASNPCSSTADRSKGTAKLLAGALVLGTAAALNAPVTTLVVGGGAAATIAAGQGKKKWDKKQARKVFEAEHALSYELIAMVQLALPVLEALGK